MNANSLRPIAMTTKSSQSKQTMKALNRPLTHAGLVLCSALAMDATGCRSHVHYTHTTHLPAPPPVIVTPPPAPPVVVAPPTVVTLPPPVVVATPAPVAVSPAPVVVINTETDFYEPLTPHGRWVVIAGYGRVWTPAHVEIGWRPYSNGYWHRTDAGWYWMSDEPWGWATYHYGRWDWHAQFGWFWVPQTQWAPAWVCWREGGGYVGWAPLRPSVTIGVSLTSVNYETAFASRAFVFVEHRHMMEPVRPKTVIVNNTTIINKTVNITNVKVVNRTVINEGPRVEVLERESGRKIHATPANEFRRREESAFTSRGRAPAPVTEVKPQPPTRNQPHPAPTPSVPSRETRSVERTPAPAPAAYPVTRTTTPANGQRNEIRNAPTPRIETGSAPREAARKSEQPAKPVSPPVVVVPPRPTPSAPSHPAPAPVTANPNREKGRPAASASTPTPARPTSPPTTVRTTEPSRTSPPAATPTTGRVVTPRTAATPQPQLSPKGKERAMERIEARNLKKDEKVDEKGNGAETGRPETGSRSRGR